MKTKQNILASERERINLFLLLQERFSQRLVNERTMRGHKTCLPQKRIAPLVEASRRFWKIFDVAYNFYKILENASKILQALQKDGSMEIYRKFFDALCKKSVHFLCNIENFASFCYQHSETQKTYLKNSCVLILIGSPSSPVWT